MLPSVHYLVSLAPFFSITPASLLTFLTDRFSMCSCTVPVDKGCLVLSSSTGAHEKAAHRISTAAAAPEGLSAREKPHRIALL